MAGVRLRSVLLVCNCVVCFMQISGIGLIARRARGLLALGLCTTLRPLRLVASSTLLLIVCSVDLTWFSVMLIVLIVPIVVLKILARLITLGPVMP